MVGWVKKSHILQGNSQIITGLPGLMWLQNKPTALLTGRPVDRTHVTLCCKSSLLHLWCWDHSWALPVSETSGSSELYWKRIRCVREVTALLASKAKNTEGWEWKISEQHTLTLTYLLSCALSSSFWGRFINQKMVLNPSINDCKLCAL